MTRCQMDVYLDFVSFRMKKKEFAVEMKALYNLPYFLMDTGLLTRFPITARQTLAFTGWKSITRCETCLKLKLINKSTRTTLSNGVFCLYC